MSDPSKWHPNSCEAKMEQRIKELEAENKQLREEIRASYTKGFVEELQAGVDRLLHLQGGGGE